MQAAAASRVDSIMAAEAAAENADATNADATEMEAHVTATTKAHTALTYVGKNPAARGLNPSLNPFPNSRLKLAVLFSISFLFHLFFRSIRHLK